MEKKLLFFVNPSAGKEGIRTHLLDVINRFTAAGYLVTVHPTQAPAELTAYLQQQGGGYELAVCCGGDGTLNEAVTGLMAMPEEARPLLGYIPAGSVNDFATSLHLPKDIPGAVQVILEGSPFSCDLGQFNDRYFCYVAAFGAFTNVSYETPHKSKAVLGRGAYVLEGVKSLSEIRAIPVKVTYEGRTLETEVLYGMVANSTSVAGMKMPALAQAQMNDGISEVVLIRKLDSLAAYNSMLQAYLAKNFEDERYFYCFRTSHVIFDFPEEIAWTLDGEFGGNITHAEICNIQGAFRILAPADAA